MERRQVNHRRKAEPVFAAFFLLDMLDGESRFRIVSNQFSSQITMKASTGNETRSDGVLEYWSDGNQDQTNTPTLQYSITPVATEFPCLITKKSSTQNSAAAY